ncbi:hypothetical protein HMSSN036_48730 [Paenibacillus macerans]|nr:hypothetical protein HMSSN036_48730 [Paenibacillus macerans]
MSEILTIRTKPYEGEALTAFLLRTAVRNGVPYGELLKKARIKKSRSQHLDMNPKVVTDFEKLSFLLQTSIEEYNGTSLAPIIELFLDDKDHESEVYRDFLYGIINTTHRRFCPLCLKEKNCYKLLWQMNELEVCNIHKIKLTTNCPVCQRDQLYLHPALIEVRCYSCNSFLYKEDERYEIIDDDHLNEQINCYNNWSVLFNIKNCLFKDIKRKSKYLALLALYFHQNKEIHFNISRITGVSSDYKSRLVSYIQGEDGYKPTLSLVLKTIKK